jgi:cysteine desulfurase
VKPVEEEEEMVYLDYNATTPTDPRVWEAMIPYFREQFGNPNSSHPLGSQAREAVEEARGKVASLIDAAPSEIVFTSGGSESNNMAIFGVARSRKARGRHIIASAVEHPSVLEPCRRLEREGFEVTYLPVDEHCLVDPGDMERALRDDTILVTVMLANNEVGTIQPIAQMAKLARERGVVFHTDAAQAVGKIPVSVKELAVDLLTIAGHKLYGPKGVGALFLREDLEIEPMILGGSQERGLRAGTENVPLIVGLGEACAIVEECLEPEMDRVRALKERFLQGLLSVCPKLALNGHPHNSLPNTLNVSFPGIEASCLLQEVPEVCASLGSACHGGSREPSRVLMAMGLEPKRAMGAVRFSLGRFTTEEEVERALAVLGEWLRKRKKGPLAWIERLLGKGRKPLKIPSPIG